MLTGLFLSIGYIILLAYVSIIKINLKSKKDYNRIKQLLNMKGL